MTTTADNKFSDSTAAPSFLRRGEFFQETLRRLERTAQLRLVTSRLGRITLHLLVALQTGHYLWHWRGIVRELART